jgi:hypothetical protein
MVWVNDTKGTATINLVTGDGENLLSAKIKLGRGDA